MKKRKQILPPHLSVGGLADLSQTQALSAQDQKVWDHFVQAFQATIQRQQLFSPQDVEIFEQTLGKREFLAKSLVSCSRPSPKKLRGASVYETPRKEKHMYFKQLSWQSASCARVSWQAAFDAHNLTQKEAYELLYDFLQKAQQQRKYTVLIITGKGDKGQGVLKEMIPRWLENPKLAKFIQEIQLNIPPQDGSFSLKLRPLAGVKARVKL